MLLESAHITSLALDIIEDHFGDVVQVPLIATWNGGAIVQYTGRRCAQCSVTANAPLLTSASS